MSFVHCHTHSHFSILDGYTLAEDIPKVAKDLGQEAVCLTDHGSLAGALRFWKAGKEYDIKSIQGIETYVTPDIKDKSKESPTWHLVLLAQNREGFDNLCELSRQAWQDGFYKKPRIDYKLLERYSNGIICLSACMASETSRAIQENDLNKASEALKRYAHIFSDRFYVELQPNNDHNLNATLYQLAEDLSLPTVVTGDAHYDVPESRTLEELELIIAQIPSMKQSDQDYAKYMFEQSRKEPNLLAKLNSLWPNRNLKFDKLNLYIMSRKEIETHMNKQGFFGKDLCNNTLEVAAKCEQIEFSLNKSYLPKVNKFIDSDEYLSTLVYDGLETKGLISNVYMERAKEELDLLKAKGFADYFLIVFDLINIARSRNIYVGPGRGSAAGSLVAFSMGITSIDPIKYNLLFFRFLNPERNDFPDIDMDFEHNRRDEMKQYLRDKYKNVLGISTFTEFKTKSIVKKVSRALCVGLAEVEAVTKQLTDDLDSYLDTDNPKVLSYRAKYPEIDTVLRGLQGHITASGAHAGGMVVADRPMNLICHPAGTLIKTNVGDVQIENLNPNIHKVLAFSKNKIKGNRIPYNITTANRYYDGLMVKMMAGGKEVSATENHICIVRLNNAALDKHIIYLMRKDNFWRIGKTKLTKVGNGKKVIRYSGIASRCCSEGADAGWILAVCDSTNEASLLEDYYSVHFGISKVSFNDSTNRRNKYFKEHQLYGSVSKERIAQHHQSLYKSENYYADILESIGLSINYPFWVKNQDNRLSNVLSTQIKACNIISGLMDVPIISDYSNNIVWRTVTTDKKYFSGKVYSLDVEKYHTYFANSIAVHNCPIETRTDPEDKKSRIAVCAYDMNDAADIGLIKFDVLALNTLTIIHDCIDMIKERHNETIEWEHLDPTDSNVLLSLNGANTVGVFQMESSPYRKLLMEMGVDSFEDLVASNALVRPGAFLTVAKDYIKRKKGLESVSYPHESVAKYLKHTYGVYIYQEQVMQMVVELGGFSWAEADKLRKIIGKKKDAIEFEPFYNKWISGATRFITEPAAKKIWRDFEKHSGYSFNRSHAVCYSYIGYVTAWLKIYYPLEFIYSLLKTEEKDTNRMTYLFEAKRLGIEILGPDVNKSQMNMSIEDNALRFGLTDIKGVGNEAARNIINNIPYTNWDDFNNRTERRKVNKKVLDALMAVGAYNSLANAPVNSEPEQNYQAYLNYPVNLDNIQELGIDPSPLSEHEDGYTFVSGVVKDIKRTNTYVRMELEDMSANVTVFANQTNDLSSGDQVAAIIGDNSILAYAKLTGLKERKESGQLDKFEQFLFGNPFEKYQHLIDLGINTIHCEKSLAIPLQVRRITTKSGTHMAFIYLIDPNQNILKLTIFASIWSKVEHMFHEYKPICIRICTMKDGKGYTIWSEDDLIDADLLLERKK